MLKKGKMMIPDPFPSLPRRRESKITFLVSSLPAVDVDSRLRGNDELLQLGLSKCHSYHTPLILSPNKNKFGTNSNVTNVENSTPNDKETTIGIKNCACTLVSNIMGIKPMNNN